MDNDPIKVEHNRRCRVAQLAWQRTGTNEARQRYLARVAARAAYSRATCQNR